MDGVVTTKRARVLAVLIAIVGLALCAYVELALTSADAADRFGWFVYEAAAWILLLGIGPFLPISAAVLVGAVLALGFEAVAFWRVFVLAGGEAEAAVYLCKPLVQLALIAAAWFAGYLLYLRAVRSRAVHG
jgi:hypothetical protein